VSVRVTPHRRIRNRAGPAGMPAVLAALAAFLMTPAAAVPLSTDEIATVCADAEGTAHCARLVEGVQLKRLPKLAARDGATLKVQLYPAGVATFTDTEALNGGRTYSLWDYLDPINAVLLYTTDGDVITFTLLQRATGRKTELPADPKASPDHARLVTADFCAKRCVNALAVWRVGRDGIRKELEWKPAETWADADAKWLDADVVVVEYTLAGEDKPRKLTRRLADPGWTPISAP
jgi:hypothetical protein